MIELILRCPECSAIIDRRPLTPEDVHDLFGPGIPEPPMDKIAYLMVWQAQPCRKCKEGEKA